MESKRSFKGIDHKSFLRLFIRKFNLESKRVIKAGYRKESPEYIYAVCPTCGREMPRAMYAYDKPDWVYGEVECLQCDESFGGVVKVKV